jgi:hypothetical protein
MIVNHPLLGPRDAAEFVYLGDARSFTARTGRHKTPQSSFTIMPTFATTWPAKCESFGTTNRVTVHGWLSPATL